MKEKIIEPSEIIIDRHGLPKDQISRVNPQIRFIARFFDYSLFLLVLLFFQILFKASFPFGLFEYLIPFEFVCWIPIEALLLSTWGTTPGKFFTEDKIAARKKGEARFFYGLEAELSRVVSRSWDGNTGHKYFVYVGCVEQIASLWNDELGSGRQYLSSPSFDPVMARYFCFDCDFL